MLQIRVDLLPAGHTHEDVDQFFSKVSHKLKKNNVETIQGLSPVCVQDRLKYNCSRDLGMGVGAPRVV